MSICSRGLYSDKFPSNILILEIYKIPRSFDITILYHSENSRIAQIHQRYIREFRAITLLEIE